MGRDWKYWGSGSGSGSGLGSGSGKSNNNNASRTTTTTKKARSHIQTSQAAAGTTGCINAVFQLFDFHHFQPCTSNLWQQTVPSFKHISEDQLEPSTTLKGAEAPRNSLESEMIMDSPPDQPPLTNIRPMRIRVPNRTEDLSSECSSSPGAPKTPNLVARLMGLDLLPQTSPRTSSSSSTYSSATNSTLKSRNSHLNSKTPTQIRPNHGKFILDTDFLGSRSLPETPRISSESNRRSEVDFHRLSLQSNRENSSELIELSRKSTGRRDLRVLEEEENRSPGFYARQIVKQVKDNISRKVGSDITNTVRNINNNNNNKQSDHQKQRDHGGGGVVDDQIVLLKFKKPPESRSTAGDQDLASSNSSPRLRFLELKNRGANSQLSQTSKSSTQQTHETKSDVGTYSKHHSSVPKEEKKQSSDQKCREIRRDQRLCLTSPNRSQPPPDPMIKNNKKEETFFRSKLGKKKENPPDKKCKKTPLSTELLTSNNVTNLFHLKRDPPSPLTKLPQKQEYNDARSSERSVHAKTSTFQQTAQLDGSGTRGLIFYPGNVGNRSWDLHDYVRRITAGSINVTELYGSVDPAVFHRLETEVSTSLKLFDGSASVPINLNLRCNRLLVFHLVNEFLAIEHSKKEMSKKGADFAQTVCEKIKNFESVDCRVLEDIDAIIERDFRGVGKQRKMRIGEEQEEQRKRIIEEIQKHLIDNLIEETTSSLLFYYNN